MRSFREYIGDKTTNKLYHAAMQYAKPSYFMSFHEAEWKPRNHMIVPNGIIMFSIMDTQHLWENTPQGKRFTKTKTHDRLFIVRAKADPVEYTEQYYQQDLKELKQYSHSPNAKLIKSLERNKLLNEAHREQNKFAYMINEATAHCESPAQKIWEVTRWVAAGCRNPNEFFPDNASQRWNNIIRKLGYSAWHDNETVIFFDVNEFEVVDEIHN